MACGRVLQSSEILSKDNVELDSSASKSHLKKTVKGKLKWVGDFESLQLFVEKNFVDLNGRWTSPRGGCKEFKHSKIALRWYIGTKSLILSGEQTDTIKDELLSLALQDEELFDENDTSDENLTLLHDSNNGDEAQASQHPQPLEETVKMLIKDVAEMHADYRINKEQTNYLLSELISKVTSLHESRPDERVNNQSVLELIQNENSVLKNENEFLRERLEVMTYTLSDLNNQIKSKDQEKESLLTAIRLIYDDSKIKSSDAALHETSNVEDSLEGNNEAYQTIHNKRKQPNVNKSALATAATSPLSTNQYSILSVQEIPDGNDTRTVIESDDVVEVRQVIKPTTSRDKHPNTSSDSSTQTPRNQKHLSSDSSKSKNQDHDKQKYQLDDAIIVGDSMLKFIDARRLRNGTNKNVAVKTFPGAKVEDMMYYVKPTLKKHPKQLIIHVGTNDMSTTSAKEITKSISALGDAIIADEPGIDLTFSEVVSRNDDKGLADKVKLVNESLDKLCTQKNWGFISHKNIKAIHLNGSGLHLNRQGSAILAKNIKTHLLVNN